MEGGLHRAGADLEQRRHLGHREGSEIVQAHDQPGPFGKRGDCGPKIEKLRGEILVGHRHDRIENLSAPAAVPFAVAQPVDRDPANPTHRVVVARYSTPTLVGGDERLLYRVGSRLGVKGDAESAHEAGKLRLEQLLDFISTRSHRLHDTPDTRQPPVGLGNFAIGNQTRRGVVTGDMTRRLIPLLVAITLLAAACGSTTTDTEAGGGPDPATPTFAPVDQGTPAERLAAARALWAENSPNTYRLTTQQVCFCPESIWADTVIDGEIVSHEAVADDGFFDPGGRTMEALFDEVDEVITGGFATLDLEFDPGTGALVRYWVDVDERMADEEHGVDVKAFEPFDPEASPADIDVRTLTDDYGCGYQFAAGSPAQDLALVIYATGGAAPDVTVPITFPSEAWAGEIRIGTDLFSNWCDDVIEQSEPVPIVQQRWTIVGGTLTVERAAAATDCDGNAATATLTGAVARSLSGATVDLAGIDLVNTSWGCFAG
jgi:uncharacterized protein DUF6174